MFKLNNLLSEGKKLRVFDFDDTLVKTRSYIYVTKANGKKLKLTPGEYAMYDEHPEDIIDYSEFSKVIDPIEIKHVTRDLRRINKVANGSGIYILTARASYAPVKQYLQDIGISNVYVVALASNNPKDKADWIVNQVDQYGYNDIYFIDDSVKNIRAVDVALKNKKGIKYKVYHLQH